MLRPDCNFYTLCQRPGKLEQQKEIAKPLDLEPGWQFLHCSAQQFISGGHAQIFDFGKKSKWPCEKQEMAKALDLRPPGALLASPLRDCFQSIIPSLAGLFRCKVKPKASSQEALDLEQPG